MSCYVSIVLVIVYFLNNSLVKSNNLRFYFNTVHIIIQKVYFTNNYHFLSSSLSTFLLCDVGFSFMVFYCNLFCL